MKFGQVFSRSKYKTMGLNFSTLLELNSNIEWWNHYVE